MPDQPQPGDTFPDVELPDATGHRRRLSELAQGDPLFLNFYRGFWCPKEQQYFRGLVALQDEAEVAYTRFVSVSTDSVDAAAAFRAGLGARWTFLSDAAREHVDTSGLVETTDTVHRPYAPYSYVLRPDLTVHSAYNGYWFWGRPTAEQLRTDLREVTRAVRPDWEVPR